jgi:hypothetical protein
MCNLEGRVHGQTLSQVGPSTIEHVIREVCRYLE